MKHLTAREERFRRAHLACVRHMTLDPRGPGVVRIHMIPPRPETPMQPFLLLLNGARLVPLNFSWAVLLSGFMDALEAFAGREIDPGDWQSIAADAVRAAHQVYPLTPRRRLESDLQLMMDSLLAIARGQEPAVDVGLMTLGEYAPCMTAPHRMDLMVSAMTRDGVWHCNQQCLHCYAAGQPLSETRELSTGAWKTVLQKLREDNIHPGHLYRRRAHPAPGSAGAGGGGLLVRHPAQYQWPPADAPALSAALRGKSGQRPGDPLCR